ncbi:MAG: endolytic transglycosylase MltG [Thermanaerothrix sp.]|uniref:endolytic transglycosylase MltG n=1 Tax=Thermanaerothrix sp. TaxID=2972675 RepID=UPI003C7D77AE
MTSRKKRAARVGLFIFLLLSCLGGLLAFVVLVDIPNRVAERFGPPAEELSLPERLYYAWALFLNESKLHAPSNVEDDKVIFTIGNDEPTSVIIQRLKQSRLIQNEEAFRILLVYSGLDRGIKAGQYELSPTMNGIQVAHVLQKGGRVEITVTILPGWRAEEIAQALRLSGLLESESQFLKIVRQPPAWEVLKTLDYPLSLEGFLMPGTYIFRRGMTVEQIIAQMVERFAQTLTPEIREGFARQGLSLYQGVILASIVEREGIVKEEYPLIASVFLNRLRAGMKLDSDPTVQYALGYDAHLNTWWKNPLKSEDFKINSPYNTYINTGLPPTPICNPGLEALQAVANPAQTSYYYFRAQCDQSGRHVFSETYEQHLSEACP